MVTAVRHLKAWKAHIRQAPVIVGLLSFVWVALFASSGPDVCAAASQTSALQIAQQARTLAATGQVAEALTLAQQALALAQGEYGTDHEYVGYILDDIATLIYRLGKPDDALSYAQRAVNIVGNQRGADRLRQYADGAPAPRCRRRSAAPGGPATGTRAHGQGAASAYTAAACP